MDNNILACEYGIQQLDSLSHTDYRIDLNQGMDIRLVDERIIDILARIKWLRYIRFSCDQMGQVEKLLSLQEAFLRRGIKPYRIFVYLLVKEDIKDASRRVELLKTMKGIIIYAQAERNETLGIIPSKIQLEFTNRYIYSKKYRTEMFEEYCQRKNIKIK